MTDLFLLIAAIGLTLILKYGFIFNVPRNWLKSKSVYLKELLSCSQCLGFWSGFLICLVNCLLRYNFSIELDIFCSILLGFASSFLSQAADLGIGLMDETLFSKQNKNKGKNQLND